MRKIALLVATLLLPISFASAQSNIKLSAANGVENEDLMNVLRFQGINYTKVKFSGTDLWGKNFKIFLRDFHQNKLVKTYEIFDSTEDEFFKIKEQEFGFNVLVQRTSSNKAKFDFRFLGFGVVKEIVLDSDQKDFMLKSLQTENSETNISLNKNQTILSFMMPYQSKNGILKYVDVNQAGSTPEELGKKFKIPRYFLIDIRFD
ncbi:hypothetical protein [Undibacterium danionis]|uniref:Uncharacterized protein n=1 Tax=Undibacterium danionis TaxID=1812100 RepID=A0ABV6IJ89_9BURK